MTSIVSEVGLPVFAFYLLVACNYVKEIFGCNLQTILDTNMYAKHTIAFLLLFFLVVIINPDYADTGIVKKIMLSVGIYIWFLITTRTPFYIMIPVLILLIGSYIASISKKRNESEKNEKDAEYASKWQDGLAYTALGLSILGFIIYVFEKKREYTNQFSWLKFFSGNIHCSKYTPYSAKLI